MNYFIFYIPGSMGSLLATIIHSQNDKNFQFTGFKNNTAHDYVTNIFTNTHNYDDYVSFSKSKKSLKKHLAENKKENSKIQTLSIDWCEPFVNYKSRDSKKIICYISDEKLRFNHFYYKLKEITLKNVENTKYNFNIDKNHKNYEKIVFMKTITWWMNKEKKYLCMFPSIDMTTIINNKDYTQLKKICAITDQKLLDIIIDDYVKKQRNYIDKFPEFSAFIKKYMYKNS